MLLAATALLGGAGLLRCYPLRVPHSQSLMMGATDNEQTATRPSADFANGGELFIKMMLSVLLVIGLGAAAIYVSKKLLPKITNLPGKEIRILETAYLGPRKAVHLVKIGNQRLLIGSTNESISMLADVTDGLQPLTAENAEPAEQEFSIPHSALSASSAVKQITADLPSQQIDACVRK